MKSFANEIARFQLRNKNMLAAICGLLVLSLCFSAIAMASSIDSGTKNQGKYAINANGIVIGSGKKYIPLRSTSGFALLEIDGLASATVAALKDENVVKRFLRYGVPENVVRCRLVDTIDAVKDDHYFSEDKGYGGKSKILTIGDKKYRVTDSRTRLSYFSFRFDVKNPERGHMIIAELPNDRERYTGLRIHNPKGFGFHFGEGGGVYSGREYPCDLKPHYFSFIFFPPKKELKVTVSRLPLEECVTPESGGAVSQIWIIELLDNPTKTPVRLSGLPVKNKRRLGLFYFHTKAVTCYLKYMKRH